MKKLLLVLIFGMILLSGVGSAIDNYGSKQINKQFSFCQVCQDATYITLSSIETPNSTVQINSNMTSMGAGEFCYNYTPNQIGRYDFRGISNGCENTFATYLEITYTGEQITSQQTYIYIAALVFLSLLIVGLGYIITILPNGDSKNESGEIIEINQLKHFRKVLGIVIWIFGACIAFIISNLGLAYLPNPMIGNFFFALWKISFYITIVGIPIYFCFIIYSFVRDKRFQNILDRGGGVNSL
jgi:hypothetical protein